MPTLLARTCLVTALLLLVEQPVGRSQELPAPAAWEALEKGEASKAAAMFRDALDRSPDNPLLLFGSANASLALGRTDAAISALKRAVQRDPKFLYAFVLLAQVAYATADLDLAVSSMEKAAALAPRDREIAAQLAQWRKESSLHGGFAVKSSTRFNVLFEGPAQQALGDRVSKVLDSAYWSIGKQLDIYPGAPLDVILYSNRQFHDITRAPAWSGGGYDGRIRLPVSGAMKSPETLDRVIVHEYVHAVIRSAAITGVPTWVNEGLASYLEPGDKTWPARVLKSAGERIPLAELDGGFGELDTQTALLAYAESHIAAQLLCERLQPYVGAFVQLLGNGHTVDQALSRHGVQPEAFYAEWRKRVGLSMANAK
jgi:tetratricopeptide (TPR) repeat protein